MTKKDYELIAGCFRTDIEGWREESGPVYGQEAIDALTLNAVRLVNQLEKDNPKFDRDKFLQACGIEKEFDEMTEAEQLNWTRQNIPF